MTRWVFQKKSSFSKEKSAGNEMTTYQLYEETRKTGISGRPEKRMYLENLDTAQASRVPDQISYTRVRDLARTQRVLDYTGLLEKLDRQPGLAAFLDRQQPQKY
jgi:hypothetical protein